MMTERQLEIEVDGGTLAADLATPQAARGVVVFAHGSGSSRRSPRNLYVASRLRASDFGTLLLDLLTRDEQRVDDLTRSLRFDIPLLAARLATATRELASDASLPTWRGYFGASTQPPRSWRRPTSPPASAPSSHAEGGPILPVRRSHACVRRRC
jgi:hypothetical protein